MKHKIIICLFFLSLGLSQLVIAQPEKGLKGEAKAKIEALKKAYITNKLELTEEQTVNFWPIYDAFKIEERELRKECSTARKKQREMSDEEAEQSVEHMFELEQKKLNLKHKYYTEMKSVITAKQIMKLDRAEKHFRMEIMKRMKDHRHGKKGKHSEHGGKEKPSIID